MCVDWHSKTLKLTTTNYLLSITVKYFPLTHVNIKFIFPFPLPYMDNHCLKNSEKKHCLKYLVYESMCMCNYWKIITSIIRIEQTKSSWYNFEEIRNFLNSDKLLKSKIEGTHIVFFGYTKYIIIYKIIGTIIWHTLILYFFEFK